MSFLKRNSIERGGRFEMGIKLEPSSVEKFQEWVEHELIPKSSHFGRKLTFRCERINNSNDHSSWMDKVCLYETNRNDGMEDTAERELEWKRSLGGEKFNGSLSFERIFFVKSEFSLTISLSLFPLSLSLSTFPLSFHSLWSHHPHPVYNFNYIQMKEVEFCLSVENKSNNYFHAKLISSPFFARPGSMNQIPFMFCLRYLNSLSQPSLSLSLLPYTLSFYPLFLQWKFYFFVIRNEFHPNLVIFRSVNSWHELLKLN